VFLMTKSMLIKMINKFSVIVLTVTAIIGMLNYAVNGQKPKEEKTLSAAAQDVLISTFNPFKSGVKAPLRRIIDRQHPLNMVNYYGNEPVTTLWSSIPANQKPFTIILIIPGHTLLPGCSLTFLEETADICEANEIPYAIQLISGETHNEERMPIAYLESRFAQKHKYFYGLDAAELYNGVSWRGEIESNNSQYIIDCINLVVKYGAYFIWSDTNISYDNGMIMQWFESNEAFYSAFKNNSKNIVLMNKESYGDPSTYSVMQGLWLAGLVGNWGVSSDWWHWQVDGDKKSLFGENDQYVDDEWDLILSYPENMYVQSMMLVMSCGGTCFAAEAPNFSTSNGGVPIAGFEYGISPLLDSIINGETAIPTRSDVLSSTTAAVLGKENYPVFNYNFTESNLYPCTGRYRIIPLLPSNLRLTERAVFEDNGIALIDKKEDQAYYDKLFKQEAAGNTYAMRTGNEWYFINNVENARVTKYATMTPVLCSAKSLSIKAQEHTSAIITEGNDKLSFYISNYRTDKTNMIKTVTPAYRTGKSWVDICREFMVIDKNGNPVGVDDTIKRTTTITVKGSLNGGGEPKIVWINNPDGSGYQNRPFNFSSEWNQADSTLTLTINHNGVVKFDVFLDKTNKAINPGSRTPIEPALKKNCFSTKELQDYINTLVISDKSNYNDYSYLQFNSALENAKIVISEGTYSIFDICAAKAELQTAYANLLDISKYTALLNKAKAIDTAGESQGNKTRLSLAIDALLRETLSNNIYVPGRSGQLEYSSAYKNACFNRVSKLRALEEKYSILQKVMLETKDS